MIKLVEEGIDAPVLHLRKVPWSVKWSQRWPATLNIPIGFPEGGPQALVQPGKAWSVLQYTKSSLISPTNLPTGVCPFTLSLHCPTTRLLLFFDNWGVLSEVLAWRDESEWHWIEMLASSIFTWESTKWDQWKMMRIHDHSSLLMRRRNKRIHF